MRYEIKYAVPLLDQHMIEQCITAHPASFRKAFPDRVVNNIYFDSPDLQCYYQNINGDPIRTKLRYRWYGDQSAINSGHIEIKRKEHQLGYKEHLEVPLETQAFDHVKKIKDGGLPSSLQATLWNKYHRAYYLSMDGRYRITVDTDLSFGSYDTAQSTEITSQIIVEIKFDKDHYQDFDGINRYIPFRQTKFSKYAVGVTNLLF
jgi:SPX domain protein involved in polyphosphate accumulation